MSTTTFSLIDGIVNIAKDYEQTKFDVPHVRKWLSQFDNKYHDIILGELNSILNKTYLSKDRALEFPKKIWSFNKRLWSE